MNVEMLHMHTHYIWFEKEIKLVCRILLSSVPLIISRKKKLNATCSNIVFSKKEIPVNKMTKLTSYHTKL